MTEWQATTLGAVCELKRGYDLPARERVNGAVPIVSSSGITGYHSTAKVRGPGVVTGRYGTLGEVFFIAEDFWPLNTALYVRDFKGNDPRFVAALLRSLDLGKNDGAAAVPGVNRNQLHLLPVLCPDADAQGRIGLILSTLDAHVENNRRRIELLEQLVQAIYGEWFVRFRYPGYENATLVDSPLGPIPAGWKVTRTGDLIRAGLLDVGDGYRAKNSEMLGAGFGLPFVRIANVRHGYLQLTQCDHLPLAYAERLGAKVSRTGDTLISTKGTVGRYAYIDDRYPPVVYSPQVSYWRSLDLIGLPPPFIHYWIRSDEFAVQCAAVKGATDMADYVNLKDQRQMLLLQPAADSVARFDQLAGGVLNTVSALQSQADRLRAIRDLLLPKLVTGQIEVSKLDLDDLLDSVA